jgi:RNA polymerase sigma-B factor
MSATAVQAPIGAVMAVRAGDTAAAIQVDGWLQGYATSRDPVLRERIILAYLGLADRLADRYRHSRGTTPEDLRQTARAGLIAAIDRYDPDYARPFVAYAVACVVGELKRHLRDTSWRLHVPRPLKEQAMRVCKAADQLQQTLGRSPTITELAERLEVADEEVLEALAVVQSRQELSLAAPGPSEEPEDLLVLPRLIAALPERERTVIVLRFFHDLGQDAIAAEIGYSQMHVSRLLRRALASLRAQLLDP